MMGRRRLMGRRFVSRRLMRRAVLMCRAALVLVVPRAARSIRIAQDDRKPTVDGSKHESGGDKRAKTQQRQHEWSGPMAGTPMT